MNIRNTIQREVVLNAVNELKFHPTPENIFEFVKERYPSISRSTVYRNLNILSEQGEINRVKIPGFADRFDFNNHLHYHVVCEKCGNVSDVEMPFLSDIKSKITNFNGYNINSHTVVFFGVCHECK